VRIPTRVLDETNLVVALTIYGVAIMARYKEWVSQQGLV